MERARRYAELIAEFESRTPGSRRVAERARRVLPGGETRSIAFFPPYPVSVSLAAGAIVTDVDGNAYVDVLNNYGALVHGHGFAPVVAAVRETATAGVVHPAPHRLQIELAEHLADRHPCVEQVRFTNSGTEAALLALRVARAVTGRDRFLLFEGGYHGSAPILTGEHPSVVRVRFNDTAALARRLDPTIAAVLVEPCLGAGGVIPARVDFLRAVTTLARDAGALVVLDEVQTLRVAPGGAADLYDVDADLVLLGKLIGGGYPIGALGGRAAHLRVLDQGQPGAISHSGTCNGHLVSVRAGLVALRHLTPAAIMELNAAGERLAGRIEAAGRAAGVPLAVTRFGSLLHVHPQPVAPAHAGEVSAEPADVAALHLALLLEGVYASPRGLVALSTVLSQAQQEAVAAAYARALARLRP